MDSDGDEEGALSSKHRPMNRNGIISKIGGHFFGKLLNHLSLILKTPSLVIALWNIRLDQV